MLFIVGPTAVGKTELAAAVARRIDAEIISADAFQIYQGLDLLTAKPNAALLAQARHHLIGEVPRTENFDVAKFLALATARAREIAARGKRVLVVGGTGLYVRALTHGLSELPPSDPQLRAALEAASLLDLQERYAALDPAGALKIDDKNKRRLVRALEVCLLTGQPFSAFREEWAQPAKIGYGFLLIRDRTELSARSDARVVQMFKEGLPDQVRRAGEIGATAAQVIGLREVQACLRGELSESAAITQIQQATRRYAKRQMTWFRRETMFVPLNLTELSTGAALEIIVQKALATTV